MQTFWEWYFPPYLIGVVIVLVVGVVTYSINYSEYDDGEVKWKRYGARMMLSFPIWPLALIGLIFAFLPKIIEDAT